MNDAMNPIEIMNTWLENETALGSTSPNRIVLATASHAAIPSARVVAIREIDEHGFLFFTQRDTRKVAELNENEHVAGVIWLPLQQRQITVEGIATAISVEENLHYWLTMPHDRQLRFSAYAPTSGQAISSAALLDQKYETLAKEYQHATVPMSEFYCGYRIIPELISFYTLGVEQFSEVRRFIKMGEGWQEELVSP